MSAGEAKSMGEQLVQELMLMGGAEMPLSLQVRGESQVITATISQWSPLAVGLETLRVEGRPLQCPLEDVAAQLAQKLSYLNEPIRVFEIDTLSAEAQLRSKPPKTLREGVEYFEVWLGRGGNLSLTRYRNSADGPRTATPFTLTLETLIRVVDDLCSPIAP